MRETSPVRQKNGRSGVPGDADLRAKLPQPGKQALLLRLRGMLFQQNDHRAGSSFSLILPPASG